MEAPVTLVRAGGGYGKTTLLRSWAEALRDRAVVAWLSLDEYDASATALCEAVDASLKGALTGFGTSARALLERGVDDPRRLAIAISNELLAWSVDAEGEAVLFLDDVQFAITDAGAVAFLGELMSGLPGGIHMVAASRSPLQFAPIGKLRATNRLAEFDQEQLRFTHEETARLFADANAPEFFAFTDGWPIALGLLSHIVRSNSAALDRAMELTRESLFDFLAEEVVARLPQDVARMLSILAIPPSVDASVCGLLAGIDDPAVFVETLTSYGLYVSKADAQTWRLHSLFRTFLIDRLRRLDPQL